MRMRAFGLGAALLALAVPGVAQQTPTTAQPAATRALPATQALFDRYISEDRLPGLVGAFGFGDAPTVFVVAGRIADEPSAAPAGPDSLWRVYSMTKPITAMAAMILVEQGRLRLDQPVSDFFPGFKSMRVLTDPANSLASRPAVRPITIRNLLTHTAGLGYPIILTRGPLNDAYVKAGLVPFASNAEGEARLRQLRPKTLAEFAERVATLPLIADPGTRWSYSIALDVMGAVLEKASGMPFDLFVQQRLLTLLGMRSTYWTVPASEVGRLATNYVFLGEQRIALDPARGSAFLTPPSFPYGGGGLVTSARDYDRFLHMLQDGGALDGVRVMKRETVALAMSNLLPEGVSFTGTDGDSSGPAMGFGAGGSVLLSDMPGGPAKGTYGWAGAAGTWAWVDPVGRSRATVMANYMPSQHWPLRRDVLQALAADRRARR